MLGSCRGYDLVLLFDPYLRNWLSLRFLRNYSHRFVDQSLFLVLAAFRWSRLPVLTSKDFSGDLPPDLHFPDSDWLIGPRAVALVVVGGGNPMSVAALHLPVGSRLFSSALAASLHWEGSFSSGTCRYASSSLIEACRYASSSSWTAHHYVASPLLGLHGRLCGVRLWGSWVKALLDIRRHQQRLCPWM